MPNDIDVSDQEVQQLWAACARAARELKRYGVMDAPIRGRDGSLPSSYLNEDYDPPREMGIAEALLMYAWSLQERGKLEQVLDDAIGELAHALHMTVAETKMIVGSHLLSGTP